MYRQQASFYKRREIQTASPGKIVVMLYDGALKHINIAEDAYRNKNYEQKSDALTKVSDIVTELLGSLNFEKGGEIANRLQSLYVYILQRIIDADINRNMKALSETKQILSELRDAFATITKSHDSIQTQVG